MSLISKDEYTETDRDFHRHKSQSQRRRRNKVELTRELIGCRDVWENIEWKGLPTLDMGLAVLQTAQNLKKPFNLKIRHDYIKIEKI